MSFTRSCTSAISVWFLVPALGAVRALPRAFDQTLKSISDAMWSGNDLLPEDFDLFRQRSPLWQNTEFPKQETKLLRKSLRTSDPTENLVLLGPMDSGTHLLDATLSGNFPERFEAACQGTPRGCKWVWKHTLDMDGLLKVLNTSTGNNFGNTTIIAIVRSPFAQIVSWREDPWDMEDCVHRGWREMLSPCSARLGATLPEDHIGLASDIVPEVHFSSTMDIINQYYAQYARLQKLGLFRKVLVLRYEDLVYAPVAMTKHLAYHLGWPVPSDVLIPDGGVKLSSSNSRATAIDAVRQRSYLDRIKKWRMPALCGLLDPTVQGELKLVEVESAEGDDQALSLVPGYMSDCNPGAF